MTVPISWMPQLGRGLALTLEITAACIALGAVLGVLLAFGRLFGRRGLRLLCGGYIRVFRGTPLLVQLAVLYFGLPAWGIALPRFLCAVLALGLNSAAYQAEYFRGAVQAVAPGQVAAAQALGLGRWKTVVAVILPQAGRLVIPSWSNELILMLKYSSIVFSITLYDLMGMGKRIAARNFRYFEVFLIVAAIYLAVVLVVSVGLRILERNLRIPGLGGSTESIATPREGLARSSNSSAG
ncbi:amino acid ABC transporter permease [Candidatus Bipolaricaulota bacterium]|nr:amino acid ABC transporter permease [Candidatus Bipolaricaulota bacterium]